MTEAKSGKGHASAKGAASIDAAPVSFEGAIQRLGQIVEQLERGDLPLEASLALFEEGTRLVRVSQDKLDKAEKRIEELVSVSDDGQAITKPFDRRTDEE